jgi:hypothetical protein
MKLGELLCNASAVASGPSGVTGKHVFYGDFDLKILKSYDLPSPMTIVLAMALNTGNYVGT